MCVNNLPRLHSIAGRLGFEPATERERERENLLWAIFKMVRFLVAFERCYAVFTVLYVSMLAGVTPRVVDRSE